MSEKGGRGHCRRPKPKWWNGGRDWFDREDRQWKELLEELQAMPRDGFRENQALLYHAPDSADEGGQPAVVEKETYYQLNERAARLRTRWIW